MIDAKLAPYAALVLRVSMGILFILHGVYLKAMVFGLDGMSQYFESLGLPGWFVWIVTFYETIGGILLILGLYTRWVGIFLGLHLLGVAYFGHRANGWLFVNQGGGFEYPIFWS